MPRALEIPPTSSPHSPDEEIEDSSHGDADEDVQGPLDHGAVHVQASDPNSGTGTLRGGLRVVCRGAAVRRGSAGGGGGDFIQRPHGKPAEPKQEQNQHPRRSHPNGQKVAVWAQKRAPTNSTFVD